MWVHRYLPSGVLVGLAAMRLAAAQQPSQSSNIPSFGTTVVVSSGLRGELYLLPSGTTSLPRFTHRKPVGVLYTNSLNIPTRNFYEGFPGITNRVEWFAIDYTGRFWIGQRNQYRFLLNSDDGSRLYLDGRLVINNDGVHAPSTCVAAVDLEHGVHTIRVSYFQGPRYQLSLILGVAGPGEAWHVFDTRQFTPPPDFEMPANNSGNSHGQGKGKKLGRVIGGDCGV